MEHFFASHQYTIQALSAAGTLLAVVAAIWLAQSSRKLKIKARVGIWTELTPGVSPENRRRNVQVTVTNIGAQHVWLSWLFFNWRFPFDKTNAAINPMHPERYPLEVGINRNILIALTSLDAFREDLPKATSHLTWGKALRLRYCRAYIYTEDGTKFKVSVGRDLRKELANIAKTLS